MRINAILAVAMAATLGAGFAFAGDNVGVGLGAVGANAAAQGGDASAGAIAGAHAGAFNATDVDVRTYNALGQGQQQGQEQGQMQIGVNKNYNADYNKNLQFGLQGNKQETNLTFEAPEIPTNVTIKNTPGIALGGLYPSANCMGTSNIGGSGPGLSLAFGTSWKDDDCGIRETARLFGVNTADGLAVLCSSTYAAAAPSCKAMKKAENDVQKVAEQSDKRKASGQREAAPQAVGQARPTSRAAWYQADPRFVQ